MRCYALCDVVVITLFVCAHNVGCDHITMQHQPTQNSSNAALGITLVSWRALLLAIMCDAFAVTTFEDVIAKHQCIDDPLLGCRVISIYNSDGVAPRLVKRQWKRFFALMNDAIGATRPRRDAVGDERRSRSLMSGDACSKARSACRDCSRFVSICFAFPWVLRDRVPVGGPLPMTVAHTPRGQTPRKCWGWGVRNSKAVFALPFLCDSAAPQQGAATVPLQRHKPCASAAASSDVSDVSDVSDLDHAQNTHQKISWFC
jgi:hypothetical protein